MPNLKSNVKKTVVEKKIAYGIVYEPDVADLHLDAMTAEDIEKTAHSFLRLDDLSKVIDVQHDNEVYKVYPVESFIAREGDPDFPPGAWVLAVKFEDDFLWRLVKQGYLNSFSFEVLAFKETRKLSVSIPMLEVGETDGTEGHTHVYFIERDENGKVIRGGTNEVNGHTHTITMNSATDITGQHGHKFPKKELNNARD